MSSQTRLGPSYGFTHLGALALAALLSATAWAGVVPRHMAAAGGLDRAWFTQVQLDTATQRVVGSQVADGAVYVMTSAGTVQAFDAETGASRWTKRFGDPSQLMYGPTAADGRIGIVVGSELFVLDASNGEELLSQTVEGAPGAAPALGDKFVYVACVRGKLVGYPYDRTNTVPFRAASPGQLTGTPVVGGGRVVWTTRRGEVYAAPAAGGGPSYRFSATSQISGALFEADDVLYFATKEGLVHALYAEKARPKWRNSVGQSVAGSLAVAGGAVYLTTESSTLVAFDEETGTHLWSVEGLKRYVSSSQKHVYAVAPDGAIGVLDRESGRPVARVPASASLAPVVNTESDRLYLISESGLLQCLHEEGLDSPQRHDGVAAEDQQPAGDNVEAPIADETPADAAVDEPADEPSDDEPEGDTDPFDPFNTDSSDEGDASDDPFGGDPFGGF